MDSYTNAENGAIPTQAIANTMPNPQLEQQLQHQHQQQIPSGGVAIRNSSSLNLGLGFLRGLGLERKTNRDGQAPKRRGPKPDSKPALTRRQELNRQAQRTHRQRKEVYIKSLEDQVMSLKELFALQARERDSTNEENRKLRELLQLHGIQIPNELVSQLSQQQIPLGESAFLSSISSSDGGMGQGSSDYATPSSQQASSSEAGGSNGPASAVSAGSSAAFQQTQQHHQKYEQQVHQHFQLIPDQLIQGNPGENQLGIDFVLASVSPPFHAGGRHKQQAIVTR